MPEPDWPQRKVCRPKPPASSENGTPGASSSSPTSSLARLGRGLLEVVANLVGGRRPHGGVVERRAVAVEDAALPLRAADHDLGAALGSVGTGRGEVGPRVPADLEGHDLAEPAVGALLEHDVRARLQQQSVERRLIGEAAPVDRRRQREDRLLELPADGPVAVEALLHVVRRVAH